jgi:dTDP-4-amino-4,6-dideoxygalactose transaminase
MSSETAPWPPIRIPFVRPLQTGGELEAVREALERERLAGDNAATRAAEGYLRDALGAPHVLLTPSGTAALELAAILADLQPGDEVVMPSFTFSSTANAVVLRGATPVFVDVRRDTLNIDENLIEAAVTERTRAIMVVHYAGVPCAMEPIQALADAHGLLVIEDAAQALHSSYRGRPAGALADMAAFSFHETKNVHSGEGGAFVCRDHELGRRAEIVPSSVARSTNTPG